MALALRKWGNSTAVRIPSKVLEELHWEVGEELDFSVSDDGLTLRSSKKQTIQDLFADFDGRISGQEVDWGKSVGQEVW
ncbi:AbrB/MazE/SpoVT family DNA-binding domain-containing protein [Streptococcus downei]|uniref:Cell growth regulatory protein n=1 Tax=Streptococcus downei MFe28 TaxID=764290 RepID=A0A380JEL9_STRDO|nr:AbrB/MazE/SpoVT family DNA-binding domain-containing protein [Streptococcus downei]EFQ56318.1 SpoVT/AbrB-like protein [Streptococcus downei F0415]SUN35847.1 cell growth regulatory protein [Streptococcus downei MFe28]